MDSWIVIPNDKVLFPALLNTNMPLNLNLETKLNLLVEANYKAFNVHGHFEKCLVSIYYNSH